MASDADKPLAKIDAAKKAMDRAGKKLVANPNGRKERRDWNRAHEIYLALTTGSDPGGYLTRPGGKRRNPKSTSTRAPRGWRLIKALDGKYYIAEWRKDGLMGKSLAGSGGHSMTKAEAIAAAKQWDREKAAPGGSMISGGKRHSTPRAKYYAVNLAAVPNEDFGPSSHEGTVGVRPRRVPVSSIEQAVEIVQGFIRGHELGGGNFVGGQVYDRKGKMVARVAYNGRVFRPGDAYFNEGGGFGGGKRRHSTKHWLKLKSIGGGAYEATGPYNWTATINRMPDGWTWNYDAHSEWKESRGSYPTRAAATKELETELAAYPDYITDWAPRAGGKKRHASSPPSRVSALTTAVNRLTR